MKLSQHHHPQLPPSHRCPGPVDTASHVITDSLLGGYAPTEPPPDWCAVSVDGSHIDVDRHLPVACYRINLGGCVLTYGSQADARFFNQPTLALVDGTLVLWELSNQGYPAFGRRTILHQGLLPALEELRLLARRRPITLAAHVSLPRTTEVANAIRSCLCPHTLERCRESCSHRRALVPPCSAATGFLDRELFQELLSTGMRSPVYRTNPAAAPDRGRYFRGMLMNLISVDDSEYGLRT